MRRIAQYVADRSDWSFDVIVHIGAGLGAELAAYQRMGVRRTILIEANPELATLLRQRSSAMPAVEVRAVALAASDGEGLLQVFNNARESSLYPPTRLLQYFPNLCPAGSAQVPTVSLERVLREAAANPSIGNLLVVDVAAIAPEALEGCALEVLHDFSHIAVLAAALPLYAGTAGEPELRRWLEQSGYRQLYENEDTVAPFRELLFVRDDAAVAAMRLAAAAAELAALRAACSAQTGELQACRTAAHEEQARLGAELAGAIASRGELVAEHARYAHMAQERLGRIHALAASLLARTAGAPAPADVAALDAEALLAYGIDKVADAWAGQARAHAQEREAADAGLRAWQELAAERERVLQAELERAGSKLEELAAERDTRAERERALRAELERAGSERTELAADAARQAARGDQLGLEMVRAQAQIGLIRDLLLRETDF